MAQPRIVAYELVTPGGARLAMSVRASTTYPEGVYFHALRGPLWTTFIAHRVPIPPPTYRVLVGWEE